MMGMQEEAPRADEVRMDIFLSVLQEKPEGWLLHETWAKMMREDGQVGSE